MLQACCTRTCSPCAPPSTRSKQTLQVKQLCTSVVTDRNCRYKSSGMSDLVCCSALWSRQPDEWDIRWEQEEALKKQQQQQVTIAQQAAEQAAWRQQVDHVHQQLIDQQKHRAALRQRLQQDALRAKQEELRRIQPVARARARAHGLFNLGLDPEILSLSEKLGQLSGLVDEVQLRMEAQYGAMGSLDDAMYAQLPQQVNTMSRPFAAVQSKAGYQDSPLLQQQLHSSQQQAPIMPQRHSQRELADQQQAIRHAVQQWSPSVTTTDQQARTSPRQHLTPPQQSDQHGS